MIFKPMDPDEVRKALEGHQDVLTPAVEATNQFFESLSCPRCGGRCMKFLDPSRLFREGEPLPSYLARCKVCGVEFEPRSGIQISVPRPSKVT
jgi:hypothetical protein